MGEVTFPDNLFLSSIFITIENSIRPPGKSSLSTTHSHSPETGSSSVVSESSPAAYCAMPGMRLAVGLADESGSSSGLSPVPSTGNRLASGSTTPSGVIAPIALVGRRRAGAAYNAPECLPPCRRPGRHAAAG